MRSWESSALWLSAQSWLGRICFFDGFCSKMQTEPCVLQTSRVFFLQSLSLSTHTPNGLKAGVSEFPPQLERRLQGGLHPHGCNCDHRGCGAFVSCPQHVSLTFASNCQEDSKGTSHQSFRS